MKLHSVPDKDRSPSPLLATAIALTRGQVEAWKAEREFADAAVPRALFVVEACDEHGRWFPLFGDSCLDMGDARERQAECEFRTRITRYVPEASP